MSKEKTTESQQPATGARPDGTTVSIHSQEPHTSVKPSAPAKPASADPKGK